jgi:hypothetical protein
MYIAHGLKCTECGNDAGAIISPTAHLHVMHTLEFICAECVEKIAKSEAILLDTETSWGKVIARIKGR